MIGLATGKYTIIRGTSSINEYGDEVESQEDLHTGVLGSVIETTRQAFNPQDSRVVTVRTLMGRFKNGTDIKDGDRIRDEKSGETFLVSAVYRGTSFVNKPDLMVDLTLN